MNLRQIAADAGVSLGMFSHLFETKERFIHAVLDDLYEDFFVEFRAEIDDKSKPITRLRSGLVKLGRFTRDQRRVFVSLLHDTVGGDAVVREFIARNFARHGEVIHQLVLECQGRGELKKMPLFEAMLFLMPAVNAAGIIIGVLERFAAPSLEGDFLHGAEKQTLSDAALVRRVDMALLGMGARRSDLK